MAPSVIEKKYTYADYLQTPEGKRFELLEGELLMTPSPVTAHQRISRKLEFELNKHVTENDLGEVFDAPYDVHLDNQNVVQPDILFISKGRQQIIGEKNIQGAPDLVVEIISESTAYRDMVLKKKLYAKFGVREYWLVTPEEPSITVYISDNNIFQHHKTYTGEDALESPLLQDLRIPLKKIF